MVKPRAHFLEGQIIHTCRGELNCEWKAIQPGTNFCNGGAIFLAERKRAID